MTIGETVFDHVHYDAGADVLYLHVGDPTTAVEFGESPEGHALRFHRNGQLVGVTIVGAGELIKTGQPVVVTAPSRLSVDRAQVEAAIQAA